MANRKFYDSDEYNQKLIQLETLLAECTHLDLSGDGYNISGKPQEKIVYLSVDQMFVFEPLADFDCRTIKLINYGKPAVKLTYFTKHKYMLNKKPLPEALKLILDNFLRDLHQELDEAAQVGNSEKCEQIRQAIDRYSQIAADLGSYQFAISNYEKYYYYAYISYSYFDKGGIESTNSHLIKHVYDKNGDLVTEKTNVVFVDEKALSESISYDNKKILEYLEQFKEKVQRGRLDLYIKKIR